MSQILASDIRVFLLKRFQQPLAARGFQPQRVRDDLDLLAEGIIDSFGIVEMIAAVEEEFAIEVDFEEMEPEDLTILGAFCRFVEQNANGGAEPCPVHVPLQPEQALDKEQ